ncbi:dicarboxylate/amino acid:cation symporter [Endozoicomonas sp. Mp262]|uniref:dicarboxylate/amino acid:cation symporter n=1 Tax=Endozoicomonas sp. Mp262 TaxID=2919499 RepID=UPI0021DB1394
MCEGHKKYSLSSTKALFAAALLGFLCAWLDSPVLMHISEVIADIFIRLLKLVSLPIIFFSLIATLSGMGGISDVRLLGGRVLKYTLMTTLIAAGIALALYTTIDPASTATLVSHNSSDQIETISYWQYLLDIIPSNMIEPFHSNNVIGVLFIALLLSAAILSLEKKHKETLHHLFESLFAAVMKMTAFILKLMPLAVWAFVSLFANDIKNQQVIQGLVLYLLCVVLANIIQAAIVLPCLLKLKGISPWQAIKAMWPALTIAFFAKSSSAALPSAVDCAEKRLGVSHRVARFSMPLCITINMNACAAFILTTVLFVSQSNGVHYSALELVSWVFIATIAAIGNAGVPMGCYMLSSAFLSAMGVPLQLLVIILPFYTFIDMLESAINVWSDSCVTAAVDREMQLAEADITDAAENS